MRSRAPSRSPTARGRRRSGRRALRDYLRRAIVRMNLEPEGATARLEALVDEALPELRGRRRRRSARTSCTPRAERWRSRAVETDAALEAFEMARPRASVPACRTTIVGWRGSAALLRHDTRARACWRGSTRTSREPCGTTCFGRRARARWRCSAASTRRAQSSPSHARRAGRARRGYPARSRSRSSPRAVELLAERSRRRGRARQRKDAGCSRSSARSRFLRRAAAYASRRRSTRSTGSTKPMPGRPAPRSSAPATTRSTQMLWRLVRAKVLARRGEQAEARARSPTRLSRSRGTTEDLDAQGDAYADLARGAPARRQDATRQSVALEQALERYERKGNLVSAERTRARLATLVTTCDDHERAAQGRDRPVLRSRGLDRARRVG